MSIREVGWPTLFVLGWSLLCLIVGLVSDDMLGGSRFWPLSVIGVIAIAAVVRETRRWWLLALLPVMLSPLFVIFVFALACMQGNCL
jgi:hypothetical protein